LHFHNLRDITDLQYHVGAGAIPGRHG